MKIFYFTYGTSENQPYEGGWTVVVASDWQTARDMHIKRYGLTRDGYARFASQYTEEDFEKTGMKTGGNLGVYEWSRL